MYVVVCYLAGCLWQAISCVFPQDNTLDNKDEGSCICSYIPWGKTNYLPWIKEQKHEVEKEFTSATSSDEEDKNVMYEYFKAYFKVQKSGLIGNIPILEAHEAFLRYAFFPFLGNVIYICWNIIVDTSCCWSILFFLILLSILIFLYLHLWKYYNQKVYELVWEADKYLKEIEKEKDNK